MNPQRSWASGSQVSQLPSAARDVIQMNAQEDAEALEERDGGHALDRHGSQLQSPIGAGRLPPQWPIASGNIQPHARVEPAPDDSGSTISRVRQIFA